MTVRHAVLFQFNDDATPEQVTAMQAGLARLPGLIPELIDYQFGTDLGINDTSWDFAITADCATVDDYLTYRDHPDHQAFIRDHITPLVANRVSVQYEID
ncbi:MAG TPA: Dabb family protein [Acidimicrobiales bacterium]